MGPVKAYRDDERLANRIVVPVPDVAGGAVVIVEVPDATAERASWDDIRSALSNLCAFHRDDPR